MNPLPPNADELVSAYIDGEAAPDEIATVESSSALLARVETMRALSGVIAQPVTPPPAQKEEHIAAALGAFDELFATSTDTTAPVAATTAAPAAPTLAAIPDPAPATTDVAGEHSTVTSFDAARQKRRPRRFNMGVIAAAVAAILLLAGLTALTIGRSDTNDVATASDAAADTTTDAMETSASSDAMGDAMDDDDEAMDEEEAMEDEFAARGGLSEAPNASALPAATAAPVPAEVQDAMDDDATSDATEEAAEEESEPEAELADGGVDAGTSVESDLEIVPFFFGRFDTIDDLAQALTGLSDQELSQRKAGIGQGIFARCQSEIPEFAAVETATLIGEAAVNDEPREIHLFTEDGTNELFYVVDPSGCAIVAIFN